MFERLVRELPPLPAAAREETAGKLPLPWDVKFEAIVRGIQVVGIWMCVVQELPLEDCPCLQMMGGAELRGRIEQEIRELLEETQRDIERAAKHNLRIPNTGLGRRSVDGCKGQEFRSPQLPPQHRRARTVPLSAFTMVRQSWDGRSATADAWPPGARAQVRDLG
jgi:hypothetical protein